MSRFIEIHALQWFPLSCINRDDAGLPKSMPLAGTRRARWSSQSQKFALRKALADHLDVDNLSMKTRRLPLHVIAELVKQGRQEKAAAERVVRLFGYKDKDKGKKGLVDLEVLKKLRAEESPTLDENGDEVGAIVTVDTVRFTGRTNVLIPAHRNAYLGLAQVVSDHWDELGKTLDTKTKKTVTTAAEKVLDAGRLVDVALFGRMLTEIADQSVEAACSVAHGFTTHPDDYLTDFWSAVDDDQAAQGHAGSANMGHQGFTSGCFYRYGVVNLDEFATGPLCDDDELARKGVRAFLAGFSRLRPSAMEHSTAPYVDPALVVVVATDTPRMLGDAFTRPVHDDYLRESAEALGATWDAWATAYADGVTGHACITHPDLKGVVFDNATLHDTVTATIDSAMEDAYRG